jgi:hypothetical protein
MDGNLQRSVAAEKRLHGFSYVIARQRSSGEAISYECGDCFAKERLAMTFN